MSKFNPYDHLNIALNEDGSLTRFTKLPKSEPNSDESQPVLSKDVPLNAEKKTSLRLYRPSKVAGGARLPVLLYFHPGGWIQMSVAESMIHEMNNRMAAGVHAVIIAVDFRLAPEHRLPAQYEDAMDAVAWVNNQAADPNGDQWIKDFADLNRYFQKNLNNFYDHIEGKLFTFSIFLDLFVDVNQFRSYFIVSLNQIFREVNKIFNNLV